MPNRWLGALHLGFKLELKYKVKYGDIDLYNNVIITYSGQ